MSRRWPVTGLMLLLLSSLAVADPKETGSVARVGICSFCHDSAA